MKAEKMIDGIASEAQAMDSLGLGLEKIPERWRTEAVCMKALYYEPRDLAHVPEHLKTEAVCARAVSVDGRALKFVPERFRTASICLAAVLEDGFAMAYVPDELKTPDLCRAAMRSNASGAWRFMPEERKTEAMCFLAFLGASRLSGEEQAKAEAYAAKAGVDLDAVGPDSPLKRARDAAGWGLRLCPPEEEALRPGM